ncbi:Spy/CpxP family protein refolding chaperone [Pseudanabaena sp. FACHB-2040]|uniref:Spy/CpxP family protein refolding chaperone n=1 Tax=Pseudanabaena sp. FACHB-2040 TaxID=2692859 RepID=UPI00168246B3|nr:Spy/CpxP family protein refolding chaperone [Pseudanabaena sp. FACHB-2040]MBD2256515.1 Spy/CpxP family protein refolding chaperone [Pseudanabaena sp. FACHB-2040]
MNTWPTSIKNQISPNRRLPLLAGMLALALAATLAPAGLAQSGSLQECGDRQGQNHLNLTTEQQAQMDSIRQAERQQMDTILTTEQRERLETARTNRENPRQVFESLGLTETQKTQMQAVRESAREQMNAILTQEQRQQLMQRSPHGPEGRSPAGEQPQ